MAPSKLTSFNTVGKQNFTIPDYVSYIKIEIEGAAGGGGSDPDGFEDPGDGGDGGYVRRDKYSVSPGETYHPWPGGGGNEGNGTGPGGDGGTGWYNGGAGGDGNGEDEDYNNGAGGGGAATTVFMDPNDNALLIAEGGGGGGGQREGSAQGPGPGGGGGGARGGAGGAPGYQGDPGHDAQGSGFGGDGGDGSVDPPAIHGDPGGTDATISTDAETTGGGKTGDHWHDGEDATIKIYYVDQVTDLSVSQNDDNGVELSWSIPNDVDSFTIHRAQSSGSAEGDYSVIDSGVSASASSYTDTTVEDGEEYYYRIENVTSYDSRLSNETNQISVLPSPSGTTVTDTATGLKVEWAKEDNSTDGGFAIERSSDDGATWTQITSGLSTGTTSYEDTTVSDGEGYTYRVVRNTDHTSSTSGTDKATTFGSVNQASSGVLQTKNGVRRTE